MGKIKPSHIKALAISKQEVDDFFSDPEDSRQLFKELKSTASELEDLLSNKMGNTGKIRYKESYLKHEEMRLYRQFFSQWLAYEENKRGVRRKRNARYRYNHSLQQKQKQREIDEAIKNLKEYKAKEKERKEKRKWWQIAS